MRPRPRVLEHFDPTPEEISNAERAKPTRLPLCIKCKLRSCVATFRTTEHGLPEAFTALADALTHADAANLTRADVERLRAGHKQLSRASRGRYCQPCVEGAVAFSMSILNSLRLREVTL